jgi:glycosyltransferase involved in cell wall biosynthesis
MSLTAIILTYNEEEHISDCLASVRFADQVIVFDSFSTDHTVPRANQTGAQVIQRRFDDYAHQRNAALEAAHTDWVLFVDADERISPELQNEIQTALVNPTAAAFQIPRHNYIFGRLTKGAGWYPDYQTRLLCVGKTHYDTARPVHEVVLVDGSIGTLTQPIIHFNYHDVAQFHQKQRRYSAFDARTLFEAGVQPKFRHLITQPLRHFWWRFVTLRGYQDGLHGLRLSALMAWYELEKYRLLRGLWKTEGRANGSPAP